MSIIEAQLGYTPRGSKTSDVPLVELSPSKIPPVFKRGAPVPWTPRGESGRIEYTSPHRTAEEGWDVSPQGSRSVTTTVKDADGGGRPRGVLADMVGAGGGAGSADSSQRAGSDSSRSDPEALAVVSLSLMPGSNPTSSQVLSQWTPGDADTASPLPSGASAEAPHSADLSEISEANEENDSSLHPSNVSFHGEGEEDSAQMLQTSALSINGVKLDGMEGLSEEIRKNLGVFVRHMREHQHDVVVQAQACIFLANYASYRESSRAKAAKAGAIHAVRLLSAYAWFCNGLPPSEVDCPARIEYVCVAGARGLSQIQGPQRQESHDCERACLLVPKHAEPEQRECSRHCARRRCKAGEFSLSSISAYMVTEGE